MSHFVPCITAELHDLPTCTNPDGTTRQATRGEVCETCYQRIDHAIHTADHLRTALTGIDRAITPEPTHTPAGPRLPHTPLHLDLDAINRAQNGHTDALAWVQTETGAIEAVHFARTVHTAQKAHPTTDITRKLHRLRCPNCRRQTAVIQPPDWYGDNTDITCIACNWHATNPDALEIVAAIEHHGQLTDTDLLNLQMRINHKRNGAA